MSRSKKTSLTAGADGQAQPHTPLMVGGRIRVARTKAGLTQADLARMCAITAASVGQWESGTTSPALDRLVFVATALGVDPIWLAFGKGGRRSKSAHDESGATRSSLQGTRIPLFYILNLDPGRSSGKSGIFSLLGRRSERGNQPSIVTHFPVHGSAFAVVVANNENEPDFSAGDIVVVDPTVGPQPGNFVLVEAKLSPRADPSWSIRQYRRAPDGVRLAARNADWGVLSMTDAAFEKTFKGTVREITRRLSTDYSQTE